MNQDPGLETWDLESIIQDPGTRVQDLNRRLRNIKPDPGTKICDQVLGVILHTVWTGLAQMHFVIWKYSLQINIDIIFNIPK